MGAAADTEGRLSFGSGVISARRERKALGPGWASGPDSVRNGGRVTADHDKDDDYDMGCQLAQVVAEGLDKDVPVAS